MTGARRDLQQFTAPPERHAHGPGSVRRCRDGAGATAHASLRELCRTSRPCLRVAVEERLRLWRQGVRGRRTGGCRTRSDAPADCRDRRGGRHGRPSRGRSARSCCHLPAPDRGGSRGGGGPATPRGSPVRTGSRPISQIGDPVRDPRMPSDAAARARSATASSSAARHARPGSTGAAWKAARARPVARNGAGSPPGTSQSARGRPGTCSIRKVRRPSGPGSAAGTPKAVPAAVEAGGAQGAMQGGRGVIGMLRAGLGQPSAPGVAVGSDLDQRPSPGLVPRQTRRRGQAPRPCRVEQRLRAARIAERGQLRQRRIGGPGGSRRSRPCSMLPISSAMASGQSGSCRRKGSHIRSARCASRCASTEAGRARCAA
jgi:hypothetical protein